MTSAHPDVSPAQPLDHARGRVVLAPDEHRRAGAGDRGAERAELRRAGQQRHRLRVERRRGAAGAGGPRGRGRRGRGGPWARPSTSREAWATLKTASAIGTSAGSTARAFAVRTWRCGTTSTASSPAGRSKRVASPVRAQHDAAEQRRADVVRMALELGGQREHVGVELEDRVGGEQPGDVGGRARAEAARERDVGGDAELEVVGRRRDGRTRGRRGCGGRGRSRGR